MKTVRISILVGLCLVGLVILVQNTRRVSFDQRPRTSGDAKKGVFLESKEPEVELSRRPLSRSATDSEMVAAEERPGILEGLNDRNGTIENDLAIVDNLLFSYHSVFQEYPYGDNADWIQAFLGANKRRIAFFSKDASWLDAKGRLVDRWDTPFFFHRISGSRIEIRSAGPDGSHWTADDHSSLESMPGELSQSGGALYSIED